MLMVEEIASSTSDGAAQSSGRARLDVVEGRDYS